MEAFLHVVPRARVDKTSSAQLASQPSAILYNRLQPSATLPSALQPSPTLPNPLNPCHTVPNPFSALMTEAQDLLQGWAAALACWAIFAGIVYPLNSLCENVPDGFHLLLGGSVLMAVALALGIIESLWLTESFQQNVKKNEEKDVIAHAPSDEACVEGIECSADTASGDTKLAMPSHSEMMKFDYERPDSPAPANTPQLHMHF